MATSLAGEDGSVPLRLLFDRSVKLAFRGSAISSNGGLLLHRELDDAPGLTDLAALPRTMFAGILNRIKNLRDPPHETAFA